MLSRGVRSALVMQSGPEIGKRKWVIKHLSLLFSLSYNLLNPQDTSADKHHLSTDAHHFNSQWLGRHIC